MSSTSNDRYLTIIIVQCNISVTNIVQWHHVLLHLLRFLFHLLSRAPPSPTRAPPSPLPLPPLALSTLDCCFVSRDDITSRLQVLHRLVVCYGVCVCVSQCYVCVCVCVRARACACDMSSRLRVLHWSGPVKFVCVCVCVSLSVCIKQSAEVQTNKMLRFVGRSEITKNRKILKTYARLLTFILSSVFVSPLLCCLF